MSKEMDALKALEEIEKSLSTVDVKSKSKNDLCEQYNKIKGYIEKALWLIETIPVYGKKIGMAIRFLMQIANTVCPS